VDAATHFFLPAFTMSVPSTRIAAPKCAERTAKNLAFHHDDSSGAMQLMFSENKCNQLSVITKSRGRTNVALKALNEANKQKACKLQDELMRDVERLRCMKKCYDGGEDADGDDLKTHYNRANPEVNDGEERKSDTPLCRAEFGLSSRQQAVFEHSQKVAKTMNDYMKGKQHALAVMYYSCMIDDPSKLSALMQTFLRALEDDARNAVESVSSDIEKYEKRRVVRLLERFRTRKATCDVFAALFQYLHGEDISDVHTALQAIKDKFPAKREVHAIKASAPDDATYGFGSKREGDTRK
jgi:hypothetical protein